MIPLEMENIRPHCRSTSNDGAVSVSNFFDGEIGSKINGLA
jgi:hypothetical protein